MVYDDLVLRVDVRLSDRAEWVRIFDPTDTTVFVAHDEPPAVGGDARVDLYVESGGPHVILRGTVMSRRVVGDHALPRGFTVALGPHEREKVNYLNGYVRGGFINLRQTRRLPVRLRVDYGDTKGPKSSFTRDINEEGVFVVTESPLGEGSVLSMVIHIPGFPQPLAVDGEVSHTVVVEDEDVPGMGVAFRFESGQKDLLTAVIDNLAKRFETGDLPEECLL